MSCTPSRSAFYTPAGLGKLAEHLHPGGVFALWSDDPPDPEFEGALAEVFNRSEASVVRFPNPLRGAGRARESEREERTSVAIATNLPFNEWDTVFPDPHLRRVVPGSRNLLMTTAGSTVNETVSSVDLLVAATGGDSAGLLTACLRARRGGLD